MAGMLPGVESARRRRFHHSGGCLDSPSLSPHNSTRRSSFCLYAKNNESLLPSFSSLQRSMFNQTHPDENIVGAAREAKQRLDEKFKQQRKSENKRQNTYIKGRRTSPEELENYGSKKSGLRKFYWTKLSLKALEQEDCAVCLESLKGGETLTHLHCEHRFHSRCLKPWLDQNSCPCCRTTIIPP
ncbi:PREDICTED: probable E3 ubiquitin-protein ligase RHY1A isoform X2 [Lupinus angustifolius]|uniref:probable E3 ubiquitin-protein ligase RHY1A isoform X2 n=1 Tax=Lupinus angustifolius TaxID=3871 RepID=UPI00092E8573|nr:PREDICTED: probable E3 ubiquitin-protein ligase RHY1A isoform X2 [Lupinus angustifolius]